MGTLKMSTTKRRTNRPAPKECPECKQRYPIQVFKGEEICVYCQSEKKHKEEVRLREATMTEEQKQKEAIKETPAQRQRKEKLSLVQKRIESLKKVEEKEEKRKEKARAVDIKAAAQRELARRKMSIEHLLPFTMRFNDKYEPGWVHKDICEKLEWFSAAVAAGESPRLILTMPPRHGKSELASRNFPAWHLGRYPHHEIISCSYAATLAASFSKKVREVCRDPGFSTLFPEFELDPDAQSVESWMTKEGGSFTAAGVGGPITGRGAHVLIIDDPIKNREEAESETTRQSIWDWFTSTAYTRLAPGGGVLVIQTRWHDADLAGRLISMSLEDGEDWVVVNYPAEAVHDELYRKAGEALHPARYPIEALHRIHKTIGDRDYAALYQQNPVPDDGGEFTKDMIKFYTRSELPDIESMNFYTAWDLAIGQKEVNDRTVGITGGVDADLNLWIVDVQLGRWGTFEMVERILDVYETWRSQVTGIEKGQIEMSIRPVLEERMRERNLMSMFVERLRTGRQDKVARARPIQARMQQGRVYFPAGNPAVMEVIAELMRFPNGVHDDGVDSLAWLGWLLDYFVAVRPVKEKPKSSWRDKLSKIMRGTNTKSFLGA